MTAAKAAPELRPKTATATAIRSGAEVAVALKAALESLAAEGFGPVDYVELRDADNLAPLAALDRPARLLVAAYRGKTRLIDNIAVEP